MSPVDVQPRPVKRERSRDVRRQRAPSPTVPAASVESAVDLARFASRATWLLIALGVTVRLARLLLRFPLWLDEWLLAENFVTRDFLGLLEPLDHQQVAPIGYLWTEWGLTRLLGFNEWSLRITSFVASVAGLFAMRALAVRWLQPVGAMIAVGFVASGYFPIRHAVEVKPYAGDLACAAVLLWLVSRWLAEPARTRRLWPLVVVAPVTLFMSLPAVFVVAAVWGVVGLRALAERRFQALFPLGMAAVTSGAAFATIYRISTAVQSDQHLAPMRDYWQAAFPPALGGDPIGWCQWFVMAHTGEMFAYPIGDDNFGSVLSVALVIVGVVALWRGGGRWLLAVAGLLFGLAYVAAWLERYPYAGTERMTQYLGPIICVLAGAGGAALLERFKPAPRYRVALVTTCLLAAAGTGLLARDLARPYKCNYDWRHQGFARWFWNQDTAAGTLYCVERDLGLQLYPGADHSEYHSNQQIYSPRRRELGEGTTIDKLPGDQPVRVVVYNHEKDALDPARWQAWMGAMSERFDLAGRDEHRILIEQYSDGPFIGVYTVYRFTPKGTGGQE
ncbi:MAG: glycosyltransferase family 39 protein [Planctomycetes bacterium]|nr:glycosyltransferase family 39 protein [Planctomycetota bacterium]